jgi:hypothetical protein
MLGIFPENLMRNVNQYRGFLSVNLQPFALKGRFLLDAAGALQWTPRPRLGPGDFEALLRRPGDFLPHEYFLPDSRDGQVTPSWSHLISLARMALKPRIRAAALGHPLWGDFFADDHPSGALPLTIALAKTFAQEARARGQEPLVLILPSCASFREHAARGAFEYAPLVEPLVRDRIDVIDGGQALLGALNGRSYFTLYSDPATCRGHFGRDGSALMAEIVAAALTQRGLVRP